MDTKKSDPCGRCGCQRGFHNPPKSYTKSKFRVHGPGAAQHDSITITARSCCDTCPHCTCFCVGFIEPFDGQPFLRCVYETENHDHSARAVSDSSTVPRLVPSMQQGIHVDSGNPKALPPSPIDSQKPKNRKERRKKLNA